MSNKRILIVDDSLTVRMYHRQILEKAGYQCDEAENAMEALETVQLKQFDLCLVDINMPVLDGYSFAKRVRSGEGPVDIPIVMISTESEQKDKVLSYQNGADLHLIKPVSPTQLLAVTQILTTPLPSTVGA